MKLGFGDLHQIAHVNFHAKPTFILFHASKNTMSELCNKANINFEDFIIHDGKSCIIQYENTL